ncbi:hypothetical protein HMPREF0765_3848 [Sphingobacterium spiritivorum ATCC 33300]|uniref:Acyl-CoA dehydrogenase, middle domain protein n=1 Tax=Sphingobacterium spiritivorum ATCC 33300 TaxID=525372 RepID=C2G2P2_SPHSI|nr:hypothetical protein [Sphingobacterium spiritivorum]EEI90532.1 hypothetical protein HMPREF0765_3848 [Sphingobacterium spiritivorum ATCC 33300]QQS95425.1 acyl-CoA dehydrogenase [Sphingobacterium spiritivorum]
MQITKDQKNILESQIHTAIAQQELTTTQLDLAYQEKWFKIWVSQELGGLGLKLSEGVRFLRDLAYIDGSLAWTITLCSGANLFVGFIDREKGNSVFSDAKVCFGGSGMCSGRAYKTEGGYLVSGVWKYATGSPHLTHFTANVPIFDGDAACVDEKGQASFITIFADHTDVELIRDWNTFGLESTASHSFKLDNVFIADNQVYSLVPEKATLPDPIYQYPFMPFAALTLLANYMGMFERFMDLVVDLFQHKSKQSGWQEKFGVSVKDHLDQTVVLYDKMQEEIWTEMDISWSKLVDGEGDEVCYARIETKSRDMVSFIRSKVTAFFPYCGIAAAQRESELNIVFRNIFTASQHNLLLKTD